MTVHVGLSLMLDDAYRSAVLPLFEDGIVDAIEWSFDQGWGARGVPDWVPPLLDLYAQSGRLWGHGVTFSAASVDGEPRHTQWLERLRDEIELRPLRGVSEHFGFMIAGTRDAGAPLPPGFGDGTRDVLVRNLSRLRAVTGVPVGLENLALALDADEPWQQGPLLRDVLDTVGGYLVLDLHNLWCQIANYDLDAAQLLATYPLRRVRCMHVAGGRWWDVPGGARFRRDTHDGAVSNEVLDSTCRSRYPCALRSRSSCSSASVTRWRSPPSPSVIATISWPYASGWRVDETQTAAWQSALVEALTATDDAAEVRRRLLTALPWAHAKIERLDERALAVAIDSVRRWSPALAGRERG